MISPTQSKNYLYISTSTHLDQTYIFRSSVRAEKNPFWRTKILGPVLIHTRISANYKPMMDLMCSLQAYSCRSLIEGIHEENKFLHPYGAPPSAWMQKWLRLAI